MTTTPNNSCGGGQLVSGESRGTDRAAIGNDGPQDPIIEGKLAALDWFLGYGGEGLTVPDTQPVAHGEPTSREEVA